MDTHGKIQVALLTLAFTGTMLFAQFGGGEQTVTKQTRLALRQRGIKTDLSDFNRVTPKEMSDRASVLTLDNTVNLSRPVSYLNDTDLMTPVGENAALVIWKQAALVNPAGFVGHSYLYEADVAKDVWQALRESLDQAHPQLDAAAVPLLSGPFQFDLDFSKGWGLPLPHLAGLRYLAGMFAGRAMVTLHDHNQKAAWTNLFAATRIVTGWQIEPGEVSQYMRCDCLETVYNLSWQAMQNDDWPESDLAKLQCEWESLDLFKSLPDTVAFTGVSDAAMSRLERLRHDSTNDEEENSLLLFSFNRQVEAIRAVEAKTWEEMRRFPGVTNHVDFEPQAKSKRSVTVLRMHTRRIGRAFESKGVGLFGRTAEAEARRRIIVAALAIKRFRARHGSYPKSLADLAPEFLKTVPIDFIDGKPLRYSLGDDGHFLLYSIGLNCVDEGGKLPKLKQGLNPSELNGFMSNLFATNLHSTEKRLALTPREMAATEGDLVWPRPASTDAAKIYDEEKEHQEELQKAALAKRLADQEAEAAASRKKAVNELLTDPKYKKATWIFPAGAPQTLTYKGNPLNKVLLNQSATGTNYLSLDEMLTLKQLVTGREPEIITYQLPINYDVVTHMPGASLDLIINSPPDDSFQITPTLADCERAANGDCLLVWNTAYDPPSQYALQASLMVPTEVWYNQTHIKGPVAAYFSSNLCHFFESDCMFDDRGAYLDAQLAQSNGKYKIQIKAPSGELLKTITGSTTNAMIKEDWDLIDEQGHKYTNDSFDSFFTITLPDSGRSQTLIKRQNKLLQRKNK